MNARCLALQRGWYHGLKCLPFHCMVAAARFMSAGSSLAHRTSGNGFSILAETKAVKDNKNDKTADELLAEDPSIKLQPVDMKKLSLPLHTMEKIPEDVAANVLARDRSIVFSPLRKQSEVFRRLFRIKHSFSVQPLGNVVHFRFYSLDDVTRTGMPTDISAEKFLEIKEKLRAFTRFVVTDDRWPLELSLEVTQCIKKMEECSENEMESGSTTTKEDVVQLVSRVLSDELNVGAWCGLSCTPVLAKMACDACVASYTLRPVDLVSGGVVRQKCYDLKTHAELQNFMKELPLSEVPVLGPAQVRLLKDVFNVERCGQLAEIEERLCFTFSPQSTEFFLALAYGTMRLRGEVTTTLLRKVSRCKAAQVRRESQFGRIVSDEQFFETVSTVFDNVYKDLVVHDFVTGRVTLDSRQTSPRVFWLIEEYENIKPRTNDREVLREIVMRLARRFAPRRTREVRDTYCVSIHFSDIRTWTDEQECRRNGLVCRRSRKSVTTTGTLSVDMSDTAQPETDLLRAPENETSAALPNSEQLVGESPPAETPGVRIVV